VVHLSQKHGIIVLYSNTHTHAAEEERQLEEAIEGTRVMTCDSTSDSSDEADMGGNDQVTTEEDRQHMNRARELAEKSDDKETKVGRVHW
jgi:hypothetical protein